MVDPGNLLGWRPPLQFFSPVYMNKQLNVCIVKHIISKIVVAFLYDKICHTKHSLVACVCMVRSYHTICLVAPFCTRCRFERPSEWVALHPTIDGRSCELAGGPFASAHRMEFLAYLLHRLSLKTKEPHRTVALWWSLELSPQLNLISTRMYLLQFNLCWSYRTRCYFERPSEWVTLHVTMMGDPGNLLGWLEVTLAITSHLGETSWPFFIIILHCTNVQESRRASPRPPRSEF